MYFVLFRGGCTLNTMHFNTLLFSVCVVTVDGVARAIHGSSCKLSHLFAHFARRSQITFACSAQESCNFRLLFIYLGVGIKLEQFFSPFYCSVEQLQCWYFILSNRSYLTVNCASTQEFTRAAFAATRGRDILNALLRTILTSSSSTSSVTRRSILCWGRREFVGYSSTL